MNLKRLLKQITIVGLIALAVFGLINYCASSIDKTKKEKAERDSKLEEGTCVFDKADLDNLLIKNTGVSFKTLVNIELLKTYYPEPIRKVNLSDSIKSLKIARIDNNDFKFYVQGDSAIVTAISLDLSSQFKFALKDKKDFFCEYELKDIEEQFPKSYSCREGALRTNRTEDFAIRIDNINANSKFKFMVLYFNFQEQLYNIEFYHEGINLN